MRGTVLSGDKLLARFKNLLETHTHVDIATAWTTGGEHLRALADAASRESSGVKVRAIVGIAGNATRPDALNELNRIVAIDLRIVPKGDRLFHPKLYLFGGRGDGIVMRRAWVGSANFTKAGFGGHHRANEEIMLEIGPGPRTDALAAWFQERWDHYAMAEPVSEVIREYMGAWKRNPPHPSVQDAVSGPVSRRRDLLDPAHRPLTLDGYRRSLIRCQDMLRDEGRAWEILDPKGATYMRAIIRRRALLLGDTRWSQLDQKSLQRLTGSRSQQKWQFWGLLGRMTRGNRPAVLRNERKIRAVLDEVVKAPDTGFPDIAVEAMQELKAITVRNVGWTTQTLLLSLARPNRLLPLSNLSRKALAALSGKAPTTLGKPENYGRLLQWLYDQPWYADGPPANEELVPIWRFRAALVDSFVYEPAS